MCPTHVYVPACGSSGPFLVQMPVEPAPPEFRQFCCWPVRPPLATASDNHQMSKTIIVVGFGPGISTGVAEKFGAEGYNVALVGRTKQSLDAGSAALKAKGINSTAI